MEEYRISLGREVPPQFLAAGFGRGGGGGDEGLARRRGGDFHGALLKWGLNVRVEYRFSPSISMIPNL